MWSDGYVEGCLLKGILFVRLLLRWLPFLSVVVIIPILESLENISKWQSLLLSIVILIIKIPVLLLLTTLLKNQRVLKERIVLYGHWTIRNLMRVHRCDWCDNMCTWGHRIGLTIHVTWTRMVSETNGVGISWSSLR